MALSKCFFSWVRDVANQHDDVFMRLFALSMEGDDYEWYINLANNSFSTYDALIKGFKENWGEKRNLEIN